MDKTNDFDESKVYKITKINQINVAFDDCLPKDIYKSVQKKYKK